MGRAALPRRRPSRHRDVVRRPFRRLGSVLLASTILVGCEAPAPPEPPPLAPAPSVEPSDGDACEVPQIDASVVRFRHDGTCLSASTMLLYRCASGDVPVLRVASEDGSASFLGGPFAVPVTTLPANVRFVGSGGGVEVLVSDPLTGVSAPASPSATVPGPTPGPEELEPLVYVRTDDRTERWLRLERPRRVADPPSAWLIGDSILHGGRDAVAASLADWTLTIDAEVGRPSSFGVPLAAVAVEEDADVVLVELGTNDSVAADFRDHLVETLELLRDVPLVLWQTARAPVELTTIGQVNEAIREVVPRYPNTALADWEAFAPVEELMEDGIHPRDGAEGLESDLLTPILESWRGAISGDGATSCARRAIRASS
jgi:hypothetical protein